MRMIGAPLVYVGPTLSRDAVQQAYPGCIIRPPIRRGDLYRDRMLRGAVFVILDGVFFQDEAISPREILDVIGDGALIVGGSSMGALRAAECWPAGMRGVGSIYRLFRSGRLESDDEVAVAFSRESSSVALVNVRYAARQLVRQRTLNAEQAKQLVAAATEMFYEDRHWPLVLKAAGLSERPQLQAALSSHDLKALDAQRTLTRVRRWLREEPQLLERPRNSIRAFEPSDSHREREYDAYASAATGPAADDVRLELARWVFASGRYLPYADVLIAACDAPPPLSKRASASPRHAVARERGYKRVEDGPVSRSRAVDVQSAFESVDALLAQHDIVSTPQARAACIAIATREMRGRALLRDFAANQRAFVDAIWLTLSLTGELDAELFRLHAQRTCAASAAASTAQPTPLDRHAAELRIATTHGYASWPSLIDSLADSPEAQTLLAEHCRMTALAHAHDKRC